MNEQPTPTPRGVSRDLIRARLRGFKFSRQQGILGPAEVIALAGSLLILVLVIVGYLYFSVPARSRLERLQLERSRLQTQLQNSQDVVRQGQSTEATVQNITESLDAFESKQLIGANRGRTSLYDALNELIRKNGLRNTSGPTYVPLDPTTKSGAVGSSKSTNAKSQSIYPGIAISVTVEGAYQNLRRFISDLETNKQFVIINSIELERSTETSASPAPEGSSAGGARPSPVSLRLEMATYFQRGSTEGVAIESVEH